MVFITTLISQIFNIGSLYLDAKYFLLLGKQKAADHAGSLVLVDYWTLVFMIRFDVLSVTASFRLDQASALLKYEFRG